jgi:hypothetical protein
MSDVPVFARQRFLKPFRWLRVTDFYLPLSGWVKAPRDVKFTTSQAIQLLADGATQVRLRSRRETHDVSILEPSIMAPGTPQSRDGLARSTRRWPLTAERTQSSN